MSGILASTVGGGIGELVLNITNTVNPDIPALAVAAGWLGVMQKIRIVSTGQVNTLVIPAGALSGADLTLDLSGASFLGGTANSGTALKARVPVKVRNLGTIAGGGGSGGRGGSAWVRRTLSNGVEQSAVGGAGEPGSGQGFAPGSLTILAAASGTPGTTGYLAPTGSFGGGGGGRGAAYAYGGHGGHGGVWGAAGQLDPSRDGAVSGDYDSYGAGAGGPAGAAGYCVDGNNYVTWINAGTRLGGLKA